MDYRKFNDKYVLRLEKGEEVIFKIKELAEKEKISLAEITGLGAASLVEIGVFNVNTKEYKTKVFEGMFEITSLVGNVTLKENDVYDSLNFSSKDLTNSYMNGMGKKEYSSYLGTPNNTYLKYNPKAKGNGVTIIRQGSN